MIVKRFAMEFDSQLLGSRQDECVSVPIDCDGPEEG